MLKAIKSMVKKRVESYVRTVIDNLSQDIGYQFRVIPRQESAVFAIKHLSAARPFRDKWTLREYCLQEVSLSGFYCEFGVATGKSIDQISKLIAPKVVHGFDSFQGLPEDWRSGFEKGRFSQEDRVPQVGENVQLHIGWFDKTVPEFAREYSGPASFFHIDCDLYASTKVVFDYMGDRLLPGSILLFDEYFNYSGWKEHEHKAFQEYIEQSGKKFEYIAYNQQGQQVGVRML
ncbi:MAG: class I SAM-dependent methyltransferase [Leptospirales bacterium]